MLLGNAWKHSDQDGVRVTREGNSFSCSSDSKNRVVNHFVHPPFNTALCAVTVSLSPTPITRPRSRQPSSPRQHHPCQPSQSQPPANLLQQLHHWISETWGHLSVVREEGGVTFTAEMFSARVPECDWVVGWLPGALHCTLYTALYTALYTWHRVTLPSLWYCSTNPSLTNMHPRWNLARSNMYGNSDI